ncbi:hypothetical protein HY572_05600 [Candidatus Micrarchaeota archaeon]|nr:hypothetical protein [Candidatus Micrarchaeota archaeon]
MQTFVFQADDAKELKKVLEADTLGEHSFTRLGYVLREGKAYGVPGYVLYFKTDSPDRYKTQLDAVPNCKELGGDAKRKVVDGIEGEEDNAAAGFGTVFG